jgi:acyl-CoA synthetase (AMP-forming)/AMP-acid ligase II
MLYAPVVSVSQVYAATESILPVSSLSAEDHNVILNEDATEEQFKRLDSAGKPNCFTQVMIADQEGNAVPTGQVGDILVRLPNCSKGYYKNSKATESLFKNGWLQMGDIGCLDGDGYLYVYLYTNNYRSMVENLIRLLAHQDVLLRRWKLKRF